MLEREQIMAALWSRMAAVTGVQSTARNPVNPPNEDDLPRINMFELPDRVETPSRRGAGKYPAYKRTLELVIEAFVLSDSESGASKDLGLFVQELKKKLYQGGNNLGLNGVEVVETGTSSVLRAPDLDNVAGIGIELTVSYVEDTSRLFT